MEYVGCCGDGARWAGGGINTGDNAGAVAATGAAACAGGQGDRGDAAPLADRGDVLSPEPRGLPLCKISSDVRPRGDSISLVCARRRRARARL